jgi:hypothetical protein
MLHLPSGFPNPDDTATGDEKEVELTATGTDEGLAANGTITMVREGGRWKVAGEQWHVKSLE